jgi:BirA family biotin operon repressor/biotin-[acetyl-CoA-carboxylase] ligase
MTDPSPSDETDPINPASLVRPGLLAGFERLAEVASTMDRAREVASDPTAAVPFAVVADRQFQGRGRRAAAWWQPPGSLAVSVVVSTAEYPAGPPPAWSLACGIAVAETIRSLEPAVAAEVRWPNDVEAGGRKLAGILVETAGASRVVFGIGVNTTGSADDAPGPIAGRVATLPDLVGRSLGRERLLADLLPRLFAVLAEVAREPPRLVARYQPLCCLSGKPIRVHVADTVEEGICGGISADGRLILTTAAGRKLVVSGSLTPPERVWRGEG